MRVNSTLRMTGLISKSDLCRGWKVRHFFCEAVINVEKTCDWTFVMGLSWSFF